MKKETEQVCVPDDQVEAEITRLSQNKDVLLARKYRYYMERRRKYLRSLRYEEKRGKALRAMGITEEALNCDKFRDHINE